jgi:hypothetical protein
VLRFWSTCSSVLGCDAIHFPLYSVHSKRYQIRSGNYTYTLETCSGSHGAWGEGRLWFSYSGQNDHAFRRGALPSRIWPWELTEACPRLPKRHARCVRVAEAAPVILGAGFNLSPALVPRGTHWYPSA